MCVKSVDLILPHASRTIDKRMNACALHVRRSPSTRGGLFPGVGGFFGPRVAGSLGTAGGVGQITGPGFEPGPSRPPLPPHSNSFADVYNRVECISNHSNDKQRITKRWTDAELIDEVNGSFGTFGREGPMPRGPRAAAGPSMCVTLDLLVCCSKQALLVRDVGPPGDCGYHGRCEG